MFEVFVPAGTRPAAGWPVAIFGHGFTDSMYGAPWVVASILASQGIATVATNVVGNGGGPLGTLTVLEGGSAPVVVPAGGRGIDQDRSGVIDSTEGVNAAPPRTVIGSSDGLRQTVVDLMRLVRQIEASIDIDGDGLVDLDANRIYYAGQSVGGIYGTILLGTEPGIRAGVPNVPVLDRSEWVQQHGNPVSYAPYIRKHPMAGNAAKPVIIQFAEGDVTVPNPTASAIVRAGDLTDRTTLFRNDLAFAANAAVPQEPAHVPDQHRQYRCRRLCGRGTNADRRVLCHERRDDDRSGQCQPVFRGADRRAASGN